jgi:hypothetical protein
MLRRCLPSLISLTRGYKVTFCPLKFDAGFLRGQKLNRVFNVFWLCVLPERTEMSGVNGRNLR